MAVEEKETTDHARELVDHFFRHESAKTIAHLIKKFGPKHLETVEDAVQEALYTAVKTWPFHGIPQNPSAWIMHTAKHKAIDVLRKENKQTRFSDVDQQGQTRIPEVVMDDELVDDQLRMFFSCCHPTLSAEQQVMLILKLLCGFHTTEIARAFLKKEETVAKSITRAKGKLQQDRSSFVVPVGEALFERLENVLRAVYLLFNEGYKAAIGDQLIRKELCFEAIRLNQLLVENKHCAQPDTHALMALMCYQAARLDARTDQEGKLIRLQDQDRRLWKEQLIDIGTKYLHLAHEGSHPSAYLLQARIAAVHSQAKTYDATNWKEILFLYNGLLAIDTSPMVALHRIVAVCYAEGAQQATKELEALSAVDPLNKHHLYYAIKADVKKQANDIPGAIAALQQAINFCKNDIEKSFLTQQRTELLAQNQR